MISKELYFILLYIWMGVAVVMIPILLKIPAPYGRHTSDSWGPMINNKLGWFIMELPVILVFSWFFWTGSAEKTIPTYIFYGVFMVHYINRIFVFPFRLRSKGKQMPLVIALSAIVFNLFNGFFNGYWFGNLTPVYDLSWLTDWRFILGSIIFLTGMAINVSSDEKLIGLRKGGKKGYFIPRGGLFNYVSSPNLFGEIVEWMGWAMMSWCLPAFSFALWTFANLVPRALDHHRWYRRRFKDYPKERKAVIPFLV